MSTLKENDSEKEWDFQVSYVVKDSEELTTSYVSELDDDAMAFILVKDEINYKNNWIVNLCYLNHMTEIKTNFRHV